MRTTIPKLRKMIRKVIVESMSPSDPDYDTVAEVISQIKRDLMFGHIPADEEAVEMECSERAREYGVKQTFVEVWAFNQSAQQFYQHHGFAQHIQWLRKAL